MSFGNCRASSEGEEDGEYLTYGWGAGDSFIQLLYMFTVLFHKSLQRMKRNTYIPFSYIFCIFVGTLLEVQYIYVILNIVAQSHV
jgi:hypothetical protein